MDEEKQDNQKTIVAFIAGLLIGGLIVWVFSASTNSSENAPNNGAQETEVQQPSDSMGEDTMNDSDLLPVDTNVDVQQTRTQVTGTGSLTVSNQVAGATVVLGAATFPTTDGWIVVHEDANGALGNALGAARYSTEGGLVPERVELLRSMDTGSTYHAVFYNENGDRVFDLADDAPIVGNDGAMIKATFTAE